MGYITPREQQLRICILDIICYFYPCYDLLTLAKRNFLGLALTLDREISPFNTKTCLTEPEYFRTSLLTGSRSITPPETIIHDYREINDNVKKFLIGRDRKQNGDPKRAAQVIYDALTSRDVAKGRNTSKTLTLGSDAVEGDEDFNVRIKGWAAVSKSTDFPRVKGFIESLFSIGCMQI